MKSKASLVQMRRRRAQRYTRPAEAGRKRGNGADEPKSPTSPAEAP